MRLRGLVFALCFLVIGCNGSSGQRRVASQARPAVARAEVDGVNVVHVGDVIAFPLYDGELAYAAPNLHRIGPLTIARHDLFSDLGYDRRPRERCLSCRTLHYFFEVVPSPVR